MSDETRWWWIRHAPVVNPGNHIYGQNEIACDVSDRALFQRLAQALPAGAVWLTSPLGRARETARAILERLPPPPPEPGIEPALVEQSLGDWQGMTHAELMRARAEMLHRFWLAPAAEAPPGGESFLEVVARVREAVERLSAAHQGRDIVAVSHGGTIRAALAVALGVEPERALSFSVDNCAITRLDHLAEGAGAHAPGVAAWRVRQVNAFPA